MKEHLFSRKGARLLRALWCACWCAALGLAAVHAQTPAAPVLLTEGTGQTTRAVAFESVTHRAEPFSVNSAIPWSADGRTRITLFVMNLALLPGEGAGALSADAEDGAGRRYVLRVESVTKPPFVIFQNNQTTDSPQDWLYAVTVRLSDEMTDATGDVHVRLSYHGLASNRARLAIGQTGGGLSDQQAGAAPAPAPATPPAPLPVPTPNPYTGPQSEADTVRFLEQATWGPTRAEIDRVRAIGFRAFLDEQFSAPTQFTNGSDYPTLTLYPVDNNQGCPTDPNNSNTRTLCLRDNYSMYPLQRQFFTNAMYAPDQLRQRVAFALHQILVISGRDITQPSWVSPYLQVLDRNAFGNYRQLLYEMTRNAAMGAYLDTVGNTVRNPNENYAREVLQLFSTGLDQLNPDGTAKLDAQLNRIPTYDQATITNFARVFTGWNYSLNPPTGTPTGALDFVNPLVVRSESNHDTGTKTLLNGTVLPAGQTAAQDLNQAIDNIYNHPNVGPFISKQLIQHLVTSNPSPAYVGRVAAVFDSHRADPAQLRFVVEAILLDPEARGDVKTDPAYGRLREPVQLINNILRYGSARSFSKTVNSDGYLAPQASTLDQDVFRPPSVFSYYAPGYEVPGTDGLLGPAFGILSTSTSLRRANIADQLVIRGIGATGLDPTTANGPVGTSLDLAALRALADRPDVLVEELNRALLHGTMSAATRAQVVSAVSAIAVSNPITGSESLKRAETALYLVASSSQYQVQR